MKKIFLCALAAAALTTACNKAEVIDVVGTPAIQFENAFVGNATRAAEDPSYSGTKELTELSLYGFMNTTSGVVFNNERLAKDITNTELTQAWKYVNTQYWTPGNTYYFAAVAPFVEDGGDVALDFSQANEHGAGVISFTQPVDAGSVDVLYDAKKVECAEGQEMNPVAFTMNHMLSKVKFSFTNGFGNDNAYITVKNIKMEVPASGSIIVAQEDWWSTNKWTLGNTTTTLEFGDMESAKLASGANTESVKERLTIPTNAEQSYKVTFDVELYYGDQMAYSNTLTTVIEGAELKIGRAYNFHATIDSENIVPEGDELKPIEFTVEVKGWGDEIEYDGGVIETGSVAVLNQNWSVEAGIEETLGADAIINGTVNVAGTLDGNSKTLFSAAEPTNNGLVRPTDGAVVKNVTIDGKGLVTTDGKGLRAIYITTGGTYTFDNVVTNDVAYALNVNTTADVVLNVSNSVLEGWSSYGSTTTATFENVQFTVGDYYGTDNKNYSDNDNGLFRPYGTTTLTNCSFADGFVIDLCALAAGEKVTFVNCTYNGAALTDANITTVFETDTMAGTYEIK